jgi:hypothetical protein
MGTQSPVLPTTVKCTEREWTNSPFSEQLWSKLMSWSL